MKWNPRGVDLKPWIDKANELDDWETLREGKRVAIFSESVGEEYGDNSYTVRRVFRITERTIDKNGQRRLIPDVQVDASSTSLGDREKHNDSAIISLYKQHATAEQFHSELRPLRVPSCGLGQGLAPRFLATRESRG